MKHGQTINRHGVSRIAVVIMLALTATVCAAADAQVPRSPTFSVTHNSNPGTGVLPFKAQDLSIAKNDPMDWGNDLKYYRACVLWQFMSKNGGRMPSDDLETAVAVVDFVSLYMRHPAFYPENPYLPRTYSIISNPKYDTIYGEAVRLLNFTLSHDPNDATNWPSPQCTQQNQAAAGLMNVFGLHARLCDVEGHTSLEYYSFKYHKWIWCDSTFNEHYVLPQPDGSRLPLGARDLNRLTLNGGIESVEVVKHGYPSATYPENTYLKLHPHGFRQYAPTLYMRNFDGQGLYLSRFDTMVYSPTPPSSYVPLPGEMINFDRSPDSGGWFFWPKTSLPGTIDIPLDALA